MENVVVGIRKHVYSDVKLSCGEKSVFLVTLKQEGDVEIVLNQVTYLTSAIGFAFEAIRSFEHNGVTPTVADPDNLLDAYWNSPKGQRSPYGKSIDSYIPGKIQSKIRPVAAPQNYDDFIDSRVMAVVAVEEETMPAPIISARSFPIRVSMEDRL